MNERVCIIHAGTHKTGTTALQYFLQTNAEAFDRAGLHFARSGWYGVVPGNYAVAWELLNGGFGPQLEALRRELAAVEGHALLSSEEFALLHDKPERFGILLDLLRSLGFVPKILLYVRARGEFAESAYVEQIKHGIVAPYAEIVDRICAQGRYEIEDRSIPFAYAAVANEFGDQVGDDAVLVRPYDRAAPSMAIFHDLLAAIRKLIPDFVQPRELELAHPRVNESLNFGALLGYTFVAVRPDLGLPDDAAAFFSREVPEVASELLHERYALSTRADHLRFARTFADDTRAIESRFAMRIPGAHEQDIPAADDPMWERVRIKRAIFDTCLERWINERAAAQRRAE